MVVEKAESIFVVEFSTRSRIRDILEVIVLESTWVQNDVGSIWFLVMEDL